MNRILAGEKTWPYAANACLRGWSTYSPLDLSPACERPVNTTSLWSYISFRTVRVQRRLWCNCTCHLDWRAVTVLRTCTSWRHRIASGELQWLIHWPEARERERARAFMASVWSTLVNRFYNKADVVRSPHTFMRHSVALWARVAPWAEAADNAQMPCWAQASASCAL